jgi:hypothetical protein
MFSIDRRYSKRFVSVIPILVLATVLLMSSTPAQASTPIEPSAVYQCTPSTVATFTNRVHVLCTVPTPGGISYFAVCSTSNSGNASRFLSVFTTAKVTGKNLYIYYTPDDTSGTACGCAAGDCRVIWGAEVRP